MKRNACDDVAVDTVNTAIDHLQLCFWINTVLQYDRQWETYGYRELELSPQCDQFVGVDYN